MRFPTLCLRLVIPLAGILIAYGGFHTYLAAKSQREEILSEATASTLRLANTIRRSTHHAMLQTRREDVLKMIENVGQQEGIDHVRILNKQGIINYSSDPAEINRVVDKKAEACYRCHDAEQPLVKLETAERARVFQSNGHRTLAAIEVIYNEPACWSAACHAHPPEQSLLGVVDVGVSLEDADLRMAKATRDEILFGLGSTVVICGLVGVFIVRFVSRPVGRLLECTRKVARGELDCSIDVAGNDEIGDLADSFTKMTGDLQKARAELSDWAHRLEEEVEHKTRDLWLAQAQIVRSEKLSSIGMLAAGVAHELNSPLTGILTYAHLLAKKAPEGSREREHLQVISTQAERCATIIRQLLDFSREHAPKKSRQDVHAVLQQAIALVEHQWSFQDVTIDRDLAPNLPPLLINAGQMQQVFLNLLVNAGEAMPGGGHLTITTRVFARPGGPQPDGTGGDEVQIVFRDTGVGIAKEHLSKIFDPFFTTKDVGKGTGLGLAVSYGIVEQHGGVIAVESSPGKGTTFTVSLPVASPEDAEPEGTDEDHA
jgi:two-component system NtrC family sensor kinase